MLHHIDTAWLYAYSSDGSHQKDTYYTVFVSGPRPQRDGQAVLAQISLSYLTTLSTFGAGALVHSYTPPFGGETQFHDYKYNSVSAPNAIAVTFALEARGAEAYALATLFVFA